MRGFLLYLFIMEKELLKKILSKIMKEKYPFISEIDVSSERNMQSYYTDKERNMVYNVWFKLNDWGNFDDWKEFEDMVINIKNALGLKGKIVFYYLEAGSENDYDD